MQKKRFSDHVKQFSGIDCIFIGDQTDESPPLVILQEDMQTILIAEIKAKDEIGLPRGDLKLSTQIKALYPTPFRNGLAVIYVCQNKIRFSNNRIEDNEFDDFKILDGTRQYFRINYDEVVFNVTWQSTVSDNVDEISGALVTNKRICIVDSFLKPLKNIQINSDFSYNFIFSSYWLGQTLLYTTQNHIHYCNSEGESQIIFTFNNSRSVICNALADRVSIATYDNQDDVIITTRKVQMLEPIIMGHLSHIEDESEIDLKLIKCTLKYLDTEQISKKLIKKLMQKKLYFSAWYLLQNPLSPQFSLSERHKCLEKLNKKQELFDMIFGNNKDVMNSKQDLFEAITKLASGQGSELESQILKILHSEYSRDMKYEYALKCAEISGDYSLALETIYLLDHLDSKNESNLPKFQEKLS